MFIKRWLRKILLCITLGSGSILRTQMSREQIEELLYSMNQPTVEVVIPELNNQNEAHKIIEKP